jgi:hypothetical protein
MFLVMGMTGKVGGATAEHLLAHGKEVRALVRNREKAANWANQGVELVDGDWNGSAAIEQALKGVEGAFVMLPSVWAPSPDYKEAKGVIANYVEAHQGSAAASCCAFVDGCEQNQRARDDHGPVASGARFSRPDIANRICARRWILREFSLRLAGRPGRNATGLLHSDKPEIDHGRDERRRRGGRNSFDRASVVRAARRRAWFDGHRG